MEPDDLDDLTPLFTALQDDRYEVRRPAEEAPWQLHGPAALPALLAGLAVPDHRVRALVARCQMVRPDTGCTKPTT
jgi:hypothetical protein